MTPSTSLFIRDFLIEHREANPYEIYSELSKVQEQEGISKRKNLYQNIRNYFYWLRKLGLIHPTRTEPSRNPAFKDKQFYEIVKRKSRSKHWINPRKALYTESYEKHHELKNKQR